MQIKIRSKIHSRTNALTTQLYFKGDSDTSGDAAASFTTDQFDARARIIPLNTNAGNKLEGIWDIIINGKGISQSEGATA